MNVIGYLNLVNTGTMSNCFFIDIENAACAIRINEGEPVRVETGEQIIESQLERENNRWIIHGYENLNVQGLRVEIEL